MRYIKHKILAFLMLFNISAFAGSHFHQQLTPDNSVLILVDHQVRLHKAVKDISQQQLIQNIISSIRAAKVMNIPIIVTIVSPEWMGGLLPEIQAELPKDAKVIVRSVVNAWDDAEFVKTVKGLKRKKLLFSGVSTEVCAAFPALSSRGDKFDSYVLLDASGTFNSIKRETGIARMLQAGVIVTDYGSAFVEALKDNNNPKAHDVYEALNLGI
jgi:nicotinamidase-related amidase